MINIFKKLFHRLLFLVPFYFFIRVIFYLYNIGLYENSSSIDVLASLFYGLRFDLAAITLLNLPFILISISLINFERLKRVIFIILNLIGFSFLIVDIEFFQFLGKKMTFDIFALQSDIATQSFQLIFYYWPLFLLYLTFSFFLIKFYPHRKLERIKLKKMISFKYLVLYFLTLVICFITIRGGLQSRSIGPKEAFIFKTHELGNLALNPVYTIIRSSLKESESVVSYYKSDNEAVLDIKKHISFYTQDFKHKQKQNVVIIILESFSYEYLEEGYAPFLTSLKDKSVFFEGYANGRRSIEILPSVMLGLPSVASVPISQSAFQGNKFYSFNHYLKNYDLSFYHGGKNGTMGFDYFSRSIGFKNYFGLNEFDKEGFFDGNWGIFDHAYLNYFSQELTKKKTPFLSTIFTLSSHQPYTIPKEFQGKFSRGKLEIHESIGYSDESLKNFFKKSEKEDWFQNTLFVITADHTQKLQSKKYNNQLGRYRVPIIFYHPTLNLDRFQKDRTASHVDILPSILDFLDAKVDKKILLGNSIFSNERGVLFNRDAGDFIILEKDKKIKKALEQYFINGLIKNDIYKE